MKSLKSSLRILALPALALLGVSSGSKDEVAANPYASNPYYGSQTYGNSGQQPVSDGGYVAPAPDYASSGYAAPAPAPAPSYTAPAPAPSYTAPAPAPSYGGNTHTVSPGDTLFSLSRRYGTTVTAIKSANGLNDDLIKIGQTLTIPSV